MAATDAVIIRVHLLSFIWKDGVCGITMLMPMSIPYGPYLSGLLANRAGIESGQEIAQIDIQQYSAESSKDYAAPPADQVTCPSRSGHYRSTSVGLA